MTLTQIATRLGEDQLAVFGAFHTNDTDDLDGGTLVLVGPHEPGFWPHFTAAPEYNDGKPDPLDRWSSRIIEAAAQDLAAQAFFPFGTPKQPFISWAVRSGRAWPSPVHLIVHDVAGLWASYRGALLIRERLTLPPLPARPCDTCVDRPCLTACPAAALTEAQYDLPACHTYLDSPSGQGCLQGGCAVRKACPISQKYHRVDAQNAFHMAQFHT